MNYHCTSKLCIEDNSLEMMTMLSIYKKVRPFSATNSHLALNLCVVWVRRFQTNPVLSSTKVFKIGVVWFIMRNVQWTLEFNQTQPTQSGPHPRPDFYRSKAPSSRAIIPRSQHVAALIFIIIKGSHNPNFLSFFSFLL